MTELTGRPIAEVADPGVEVADPGVEVERHPDRVCIRFNRPPVNAITLDGFATLRAGMSAVRDESLPVLLTGANGVFCAGYDIKQRVPSASAASSAAARQFLAALQAHPSPVVAAVDGAAVGLGLLIAASADIMVIARTARLRMPEVTLGITSDVAPLRRFLPEPWVRRMCLLGEVFTAEELQLDAAGAQLCEPGTAEATADALLVAMDAIDTQFLQRTKHRLYE